MLFILFRLLSSLLPPPSPSSLIPSSDECECLGEQRKHQPHLHLLGTRDWYVNNDQQPTPLSLTAASERLFFYPCLVFACTEFGSLHVPMIQVEAGSVAAL